jgi:hypothetical protein
MIRTATDSKTTATAVIGHAGLMIPDGEDQGDNGENCGWIWIHKSMVSFQVGVVHGAFTPEV